MILTGNGHDVDLVHRPRQIAEKAQNHSNHTKNNRAGTVVGDGVECDREGEDVTGAEEDEE